MLTLDAELYSSTSSRLVFFARYCPILISPAHERVFLLFLRLQVGQTLLRFVSQEQNSLPHLRHSVREGSRGLRP